jgi:hypothetical protein
MAHINYFLILLVSLLITSCSELTPFPDKGDPDQMNLEEIAVYINNYVGNAEADHSNQCQTVPIGAKPCGGPWGHLVFSTKTASKDVLSNLVERYNDLDEIRNKEEGRASTCDYATKPEVTLTAGTCRGERYAWNPGDILKFNGIE